MQASAAPLVFPGDPEYLFNAGLPGQYLPPAILTDTGGKTAGMACEFQFACLIMDKLAHVLIDQHQLVDTGP